MSLNSAKALDNPLIEKDVEDSSWKEGLKRELQVQNVV